MPAFAKISEAGLPNNAFVTELDGGLMSTRRKVYHVSAYSPYVPRVSMAFQITQNGNLGYLEDPQGGGLALENSIKAWIQANLGTEWRDTYDPSFMDWWKACYKSFDGTYAADTSYSAPIDKPLLASDYYDKSTGMVSILYGDLEAIYDGTIRSVLKLLRDQLVAKQDIARLRLTKAVKLYSGLGDYLYIKRKVLEWCTAEGIAAIFPAYPSHVTVHGMAGLHDE